MVVTSFTAGESGVIITDAEFRESLLRDSPELRKLWRRR
jgi:hypothetical protein